jgi:hypothetical protein
LMNSLTGAPSLAAAFRSSFKSAGFIRRLKLFFLIATYLDRLQVNRRNHSPEQNHLVLPRHSQSACPACATFPTPCLTPPSHIASRSIPSSFFS